MSGTITVGINSDVEVVKKVLKALTLQNYTLSFADVLKYSIISIGTFLLLTYLLPSRMFIFILIVLFIALMVVRYLLPNIDDSVKAKKIDSTKLLNLKQKLKNKLHHKPQENNLNFE